MSDKEFLSPPDPVSKPQLLPPAGATDSHAHVFGPFNRFPLAKDCSYTTAELSGEYYLKMLDELGFERGVIVTASAYGTDNSAMLNALQLNPKRLRGVAVITPEITDAELIKLHDAGVRGARFSLMPNEIFSGTVGFDALKRLAPRLIEMGWHAKIWTFCDLLISEAPDLLKLKIPLVVDHMGIYDHSRGIGDKSFQWLLAMIEEGNLWLKLTAYRLSQSFPNYPELKPFHKALLAANSDQLIWGSDWPHVSMTSNMPDVGHLVDLLDNWTEDDDLRQRILVDNSARLYDF